MMVLGLLLVTLLLAWGLTACVRHYALKRSVLDMPNARSSHKVPTPRGGGVAIVLAFLAGLPVLALLGGLDAPLMWALLGAGAWIALLGFLDDHGHIAALWRLLGHFMGAAWVLFWLGGASDRGLGCISDVGLGGLWFGCFGPGVAVEPL